MAENVDSAFEQEQEKVEEQSQGAPALRRKKIWQINSGYYCSVIGTCLSRRELTQIARKKVFSFEPGLDAFAVHRRLSAIASDRLPKTRALNKILDDKFKVSIKRYSCLLTDEDVQDEWKKDLKSGNGIPGAYWAIMTRATCGKEVLDQVYGDCHMVSYDIFSSYFDNAKATASLRKQIEILQCSLEKTKTTYQKERECIRWELGELQKSKGEFLRQRLVSEYSVKENKELRMKLEKLQNGQKNISLQKESDLLRKENETLKLTVKVNEEKSKFDDERGQRTGLAIDCLQDEIGTLSALNAELQEEIMSLEEMFQLGMGSKSVCDRCEEKQVSGCQGIGLSGKAVLYVGGRNNMIAHYREMVEKHGGIFLHHDGGKESSRSLLPKMLSGADAVLCPIDCISHDACKCVKKICKRNSKPYVMMRSSGLSSLAKGLETIIQ